VVVQPQPLLSPPPSSRPMPVPTSPVPSVRPVSESLVPEVVVGDYVMVHAGFAIQKYDEDEALKTLALFREIVKGMEGEP
jgi:hypothetical protein